ncbi:MAG: anti-sigma factor [Gemmatimonadota bacterium]|nr:anti-sigma factor [Gemmatimonadota bacterium]MDH3427496.1 anti-sigma factor [Gemmatimonadota bacterium]
MNCERALELLFDFLDGELENATHEEVARHLAVCRECYPYFNFQRLFLDRLAASHEPREAPSKLTRQIRELLDRETLE